MSFHPNEVQRRARLAAALLFLAFVFLGKWIADLIFLAAEHRLGGSEFLAQALLWSPLSAAVTAGVGLAVLVLVRPVVGTPRG